MDSYVMKFPLFLKELWVTMLDRARKANQLEKKNKQQVLWIIASES